jgi:hypothetical protein
MSEESRADPPATDGEAERPGTATGVRRLRRPGGGRASPPSGPRARGWLDAIESVLDATIETDEAVACRFDDLTVDVPLRPGTDSPRARWRLDGTVTVSVDGTRGPLAEWLDWWSRQV